jgi:hypothetical protein
MVLELVTFLVVVVTCSNKEVEETSWVVVENCNSMVEDMT